MYMNVCSASQAIKRQATSELVIIKKKGGKKQEGSQRDHVKGKVTKKLEGVRDHVIGNGDENNASPRAARTHYDEKTKKRKFQLSFIKKKMYFVHTDIHTDTMIFFLEREKRNENIRSECDSFEEGKQQHTQRGEMKC